jgi:NhaP-type Na+/H+ or K+/H+ antiporter
LWTIAEIFLFVLMGASIQIAVLEKTLLPGLLLLAIGLSVGRMVGWYLSTMGSNWNWRERLFLLPGNSAKATVQAAIGAIPLAAGIDGGETILAIAALSILVTAPLGAWAIPTFAPKLLEKGAIDPTKVTVATRTTFLAAVDTSPLAPAVLTKTADLARRSNARAIVLHVVGEDRPQQVEELRQVARRLLSDIEHEFFTVNGAAAEAIVQLARDFRVTAIVLGKRGHQPWENVLVGSVSRAVLETSEIPAIVVEDESRGF